MDKKTRIIVFVTLFILLISILAYFLSSTITADQKSDKITVAASIMPQKEFIAKIGGNKVNVVIMVPAGANPHTYEAEPSTLKEVSQADIYFEVGSGIEFELTWMDKLKSINPSMTIINSSKGISFIENAENHNNSTKSSLESESDPHVWTSPKNAMIMVENTYQGLVKIDPANQKYYEHNKEKYIKELKALDNNISNNLSTENGTKILVYHPAWAYFCQEFDLQQIAIEKEGKEPTPQTMADIITQAKKDNIKVILASPQVNRRSADTIAQELGGEVVIIDPLSEDYLKNMNYLSNVLNNYY